MVVINKSRPTFNFVIEKFPLFGSLTQTINPQTLLAPTPSGFLLDSVLSSGLEIWRKF